MRGDNYYNCTLKRVRANAKTDTLRADVPKGCLAPGPLKIRVETSIGTFRSDAPLKSRDRLAVPGKPALYRESPQ